MIPLDLLVQAVLEAIGGLVAKGLDQRHTEVLAGLKVHMHQITVQGTVDLAMLGVIDKQCQLALNMCAEELRDRRVLQQSYAETLRDTEIRTNPVLFIQTRSLLQSAKRSSEVILRDAMAFQAASATLLVDAYRQLGISRPPPSLPSY
jgi:hypothetical protein